MDEPARWSGRTAQQGADELINGVMPTDILPNTAIAAGEVGERSSMGGACTAMHALGAEESGTCPMNGFWRYPEFAGSRVCTQRQAGAFSDPPLV